MNNDQREHLKKKLEGEKQQLETELESIGRRNPNNPDDWEATPEKMDLDSADKNEVADGIEAFEENTGILKQLEIRYNQVLRALKRMEEGRYGICEISGKEIELDRLEANPAARTCKEHMDKEHELELEK